MNNQQPQGGLGQVAPNPQRPNQSSNADLIAAENIAPKQEFDINKEIADLKAQLAAFMALNNISNTEPEPELKMVTVQKTASNGPTEIFINTPANNTVQKPVPTTQAAPQPQTPAPVYNLPSPDNEPLNRLDLENAEHLEKPAYIKCRGFFIRGMKELSAEIEFILNDTTPNTIKKSERIQNLLEIIKKSE